MNLNLSTPPRLMGDTADQLRQITSYLFQLQRDLNVALDSVDSVAKEAAEITAATAAENTVSATAKSLKSLIIKTAGVIQKEMDEWTQTLSGTYLAISDYGTYQEEVSQEIIATATQVANMYNYESIIQALQTRVNELETDNTILKSYKVQTEQYTKTGLLYYDELDVPVYGYAVGEVLTRVIVNGEETVRREDLMATWSAGRLNFWQGGSIVAYYANNKMYVTDGEFLNSLQIGDWIITTAGGNLDIDYAGEDE
jgi:hypothetical protein